MHTSHFKSEAGPKYERPRPIYQTTRGCFMNPFRPNGDCCRARPRRQMGVGAQRPQIYALRASRHPIYRPIRQRYSGSRWGGGVLPLCNFNKTPRSSFRERDRAIWDLIIRQFPAINFAMGTCINLMSVLG